MICWHVKDLFTSSKPKCLRRESSWPSVSLGFYITLLSSNYKHTLLRRVSTRKKSFKSIDANRCKEGLLLTFCWLIRSFWQFSYKTLFLIACHFKKYLKRIPKKNLKRLLKKTVFPLTFIVCSPTRIFLLWETKSYKIYV